MNERSHLNMGILGGSFDPVHLGHINLAQTVLDFFSLERIYFIPAHQSPHKKAGKASTADRWKMLELALSEFPHFELDDIEIKREKVSYTIDTLKKIHEKSNDEEYYLILGADAFEQIHTWKNVEKIMQYANMIIGARHGSPWEADSIIAQKTPLQSLGRMEKIISKRGNAKFKNKETGKTIDFFECPLLDISSSQAREAIQHGLSVKKMLPSEVEQYIIHQSLYIASA